MLRYFSIRLFRALLSIALVITFTFVVLRASGDPALQILGPNAQASALAAFRRSWGLDQPLWWQYVDYFYAILRGDLGRSMLNGQSALGLVADRIPMSLALTVPALLINVVLGVSAGVYAALHRDTFIDRAVMVFSVIGFTVPSYVLGLTLILLFSVQFGVLPSGGSDQATSLVLPVLTLGIGGAATLARFTRSAMIEVLGQLYVTAASAKGVPWRAVVRHHAFKNACIPILTLLGLMLGGLIAGAVLVENVFGWPGVGQLLTVSVARRDLAVVQVILLLVAATMTTANLLVDILYGIIDPRLRSRPSERD